MYKYLCVLCVLCGSIQAAQAVDVTPLRSLPVLDHGRVKPIDTVARESIQYITGKESFGEVKTDESGAQAVPVGRDSLDVALDFAAHPVAWQTRPVLYVPWLALRTKLGMKETEQWISPRAVMENTQFTSWAHDLESKKLQAQQAAEKIFQTPLEIAAMELDDRLKMFEAVCDMSIYCVLPTNGAKSDEWLPIPALASLTGQDAQMTKPIQTAWTGVMDAYKSSDNAAFATASTQFADSIRQLVGPDYYNPARIDREVFYNHVKPFRLTWIVYFVAVFALVMAMMLRGTMTYGIAMTLFGSAILFHGSAFALRCSISGWAPVTNMYETVIWVGMMSAVFSFILELVYRKRTIAMSGAIVALLATIVADNMPPELGQHFRNLTPVLRSNYWLTIHVLTEVSSYAAFALALVLGNILLAQFIYGKTDPAIIRNNVLFTYRAIQIGVLLVASGTILGGLWANESWGRFWGWDPKEVWALIVLLTYLALLHGRFAGWIKQFGLAVWAVMGFTAVVMSWYGVNFVLGAGLHSYGFGVGGKPLVFSAVGLQWAYVLLACIIHRGRQAVGSSRTTLPETDRPDDLPRAAPVTGK